MPQVTRRTLLAFTAVASVVEQTFAEGEAASRELQAEASFRMVRECGRLSRIGPVQSANRSPKVQGKAQVNSPMIDISQLKQPVSMEIWRRERDSNPRYGLP
jgi:hypothetical protein